MQLVRCDAPWDKLDEGGGWCAHQHTEVLFEALETKALWDDYGIVNGIMVSLQFYL